MKIAAGVMLATNTSCLGQGECGADGIYCYGRSPYKKVVWLWCGCSVAGVWLWCGCGVFVLQAGSVTVV
jgi:hypothetical protein